MLALVQIDNTSKAIAATASLRTSVTDLGCRLTGTQTVAATQMAPATAEVTEPETAMATVKAEARDEVVQQAVDLETAVAQDLGTAQAAVAEAMEMANEMWFVWIANRGSTAQRTVSHAITRAPNVSPASTSHASEQTASEANVNHVAPNEHPAKIDQSGSSVSLALSVSPAQSEIPNANCDSILIGLAPSSTHLQSELAWQPAWKRLAFTPSKTF
jgi:hypothetical protein